MAVFVANDVTPPAVSNASNTTEGPQVDFQHPQYTQWVSKWTKCRDCVEGEDRVKDQQELYLPKLSEQDPYEYKAYRDRASFYEATGRTVKALSGAIMRKPPEVDGPDSLEEILEALGVNGEPLTGLVTQEIEDVLTTGRVGLYVDAPAEGDDAPPYVALYFAENVINWRFTVDAEGKRVPSLVVLRERNEVPDDSDPFRLVVKEQYRVLLLEGDDPDSWVYKVEVWEKQQTTQNGKTVTVWKSVSETYPKKKGGKTLNYIPFLFVTPSGVSPLVERPPILGLANLNLSHYRSTADLEHGCHYTALPTAWASGFDLGNKTKLKIGSATAWISENENAKVGYLEFSGAGLSAIEKRLDRKEQQMAVLGARLLEGQNPTGVEAAETVKLRHAGEHSVLSNVAIACSQGMTQALRWVADWLGETADPEDITLELNTDFNTVGLDSGLLLALMQAVQSGNLSWDSWFYNLKRGELLPDGRTKDDELELIQANPVTPPGTVGTGDDADADEEETEEGTEPGETVVDDPAKRKRQRAALAKSKSAGKTAAAGATAKPGNGAAPAGSGGMKPKSGGETSADLAS